MSCSIQLLFLIFYLIAKSISFKVLFEDDFNKLNETNWKIISSDNHCKSEFTLIKTIQKTFLFNSELTTKQLALAI